MTRCVHCNNKVPLKKRELGKTYFLHENKERCSVNSVGCCVAAAEKASCKQCLDAVAAAEEKIKTLEERIKALEEKECTPPPGYMWCVKSYY